MEDSPRLIAEAGTAVTCEGGHPIATVKRDIFLMSRVSLYDFDWHIESPKPGDVFALCPICRKPFVRSSFMGLSGSQFHTPDGWVPKPPPLPQPSHSSSSSPEKA